MEAPVAGKKPKELTIHGDTRIDNYYWLRERENPEVITYLEAENAYRESMMEGTKKFQKDLFYEIVGRIKQDDESVPYKDNGYYYYSRYEEGREYPCSAEDAAYATFLCEGEDGELICHFNSSWVVRVRRDDLVVFLVEGSKGTALAGLRDCWIQPAALTPRPVWNPDLPQELDFYEHWQKLPDNREYDNAFKVQWELFLKHVVADEPFPWTLLAGAKGVQLAEAGMRSWAERRWIDLEELKG